MILLFLVWLSLIFLFHYCLKFIILVLLLFDIIRHGFLWRFLRSPVHLGCRFLNFSRHLFASRVIKSSLLNEEESKDGKRVQLGQMHSILLGCKRQLRRLPAVKGALTGWQRWPSSASLQEPFRLGLFSHFYLEDRNVLNYRSLANDFVRDAGVHTAFSLVILRGQKCWCFILV